jgi:transposase
MSAMTLPANLDQLTTDELRELVLSQAAVITRNDQELNWRQAKIDKLTHEVAYYKRHYFGVKAEHLPAPQGQLFEETIAADMAAITEELAQLSEAKPKGQAKRTPLPPDLPRTEIHHEPESTACACGCQMKRIGEDVAEKLDYTPGTFTVERHIRGKWACAQCETLVQAPVSAHVIDASRPRACSPMC